PCSWWVPVYRKGLCIERASVSNGIDALRPRLATQCGFTSDWIKSIAFSRPAPPRECCYPQSNWRTRVGLPVTAAVGLRRRDTEVVAGVWQGAEFCEAQGRSMGPLGAGALDSTCFMGHNTRLAWRGKGFFSSE